MAELRDEYGNPIQLTDQHGNPVKLTDEFGNPMHLTGVASTHPIPTAAVDAPKTTVEPHPPVSAPAPAPEIGDQGVLGGAAPVAARPASGVGVEFHHEKRDSSSSSVSIEARDRFTFFSSVIINWGFELCFDMHVWNINVQSEDDGQGGRRKKGLKEKIKERLTGGKHKEEHGPAPTTTTAAAGIAEQQHHHHEQHEKKGMLEKIKEKLPGHHHTSHWTSTIMASSQPRASLHVASQVSM